ncbi:MAG: enoyl-CoA hydratase/isomerase family protein [Deltaproteobacteria bacterium]|nr:enoyl-CoA hydratase/isomerase family protein [Deltaproteobacteria bacterium]
MSEELVLLEKTPPLATITINRPKALNALNSKVLAELDKTLDRVNEDEEIRVVIITGSGEKAFVAGADIAEMSEMSPLEGSNFSRLGQLVFQKVQDLKKPVIAAVNGYALGGGSELALACDFIYASENAKFGLPEVTLGIFPGFGGTQRLPRLIGKSRAKELIFTGKMISAAEAYEMGMVNKVVPLDQLMDAVKEVATQIAKNGPIAVYVAKNLVDVGYDIPLDDGCLMESRSFGMCCSTEDKKEGMKAFLEKRKPVFKGR